MEKEQQEQVNYSTDLPENYSALDYSLDHNPHPHLMKPQTGENSVENNLEMVDYMFNNPTHLQQSSPFSTSTSLDKLNFSEVMQFADFGPKLALNQTKATDGENGIDPVYFLKFPVLNERIQNQNLLSSTNSAPTLTRENENEFGGDGDENRLSGNNKAMHHGFSLDGLQKNPCTETKNRRKRPRSVKTSEEVESQRMTHIAVERNRRKQMNEHLRVLRSLMPGSYVQRGDQASIIGGAIEFVRELEQLLQCLESQKRRRLYGTSDTPRPITEPADAVSQLPDLPYSFPPMPLPNEQIKFGDYETGLLEDIAENKSCLADVEVKVLGFDALIKILSRRRPGQLIKTIEALEDLQFIILHTNITTIEQTVLYTFNVKVASESAFTAEDIASSVQQIFGFIHASSGI